MKFSSIRYLIKEGFRGAWANRLMSLASIGVLVACMVIIGLAVLISENVNMAVNTLEQENVIEVYLKDRTWAELFGEDEGADSETDGSNITENEESTDVDDETIGEKEISESDYLIHNEEEALAVCDKILSLENVKEARFISSAEGLKEATAHISEDYMELFTFLEEENPVLMAIEVRMEDMNKFDKTLEQIKSMDEVFKVRTYEGLADTIVSVKDGIYIAGVWIIAILVVISLVVVSNTIRVTMYNRKLEIGIMKAVGATNTFIRIPFVIEGILIGLISALISEGLLYFCYRVATETILKDTAGSDIVQYGDMAWYLLALFVIIGVIAGMLGSFIIIRKYLKREGSEFTAI